MQKEYWFNVLWVDDPQPTGEPNVKFEDILKINMYF